MARMHYAIALGSNRRHGRHGAPARILSAAVKALSALGMIVAMSRIRSTPAMGPAGRSFANAALILETELDPAELLETLKRLERDFGRRGGRNWGPRVLDLDIILWSEGSHADGMLTIPHAQFRERAFVLDPLIEIAPSWRDPISGRSVRQLRAIAKMPRPVDRKPART